VRGASVAAVVLAHLWSGCSKGPATPSTTTAPATVTEIYASTLPVGGVKFYSFSTLTTGTVTATLNQISGDGVPPTVIVNLGIGVPGGTSCNATSSPVQVTGDAGVTTLVTATQRPGVSCVVVTDVGNLEAPAAFVVTIDHP
jgi:hypothetical protein